MLEVDKTLVNNGITLFVIKVDVTPESAIDFADLASSMSNSFDRIEKRERTNFEVNVTGQDVKTATQAGIDYVLIKADSFTSLILSQTLNCIALECRKYLNNTQYKELFEKIATYLTEKSPVARSRRIGMRFVNEFRCANVKDINKIFESQRAKNVSTMVHHDSVSRIIAQEEYNFNDSKLRVQYGIPNKFYPAVLNNYDLLLDIDAFDDSLQPLSEWANVLRVLNHHAYDAFVGYINPKYLEELK